MAHRIIHGKAFLKRHHFSPFRAFDGKSRFGPRFYDELLPTSQHKPERSIHLVLKIFSEHMQTLHIRKVCRTSTQRSQVLCFLVVANFLHSPTDKLWKFSIFTLALVCTNISWTSIRCGINKTGVEAAPSVAKNSLAGYFTAFSLLIEVISSTMKNWS